MLVQTVMQICLIQTYLTRNLHLSVVYPSFVGSGLALPLLQQPMGVEVVGVVSWCVSAELLFAAVSEPGLPEISRIAVEKCESGAVAEWLLLHFQMEHPPPLSLPLDVATTTLAAVADGTVKLQQLPSSLAESPSQYLVGYSSQTFAAGGAVLELEHAPAGLIQLKLRPLFEVIVECVELGDGCVVEV